MTCTGCGNDQGQDSDPRYVGMCAGCAWRRWFKDSGNADFWSKVECIECELGRDCPKHPEVTA
jgi:hypothetical protein